MKKPAARKRPARSSPARRLPSRVRGRASAPCPECGGISQVLRTARVHRNTSRMPRGQGDADGTVVMRRRECCVCGSKFHTTEKVMT